MSNQPRTTNEHATEAPLLRVRDLHVRYDTTAGRTADIGITSNAVDNVSLRIKRGESLGLVGESGSGKTTLAHAIMRLQPAHSGQIHFDEIDLLSLSNADMRNLRQRMQMVFQDSTGSLNPHMPVEQLIGEPLVIHRLAKGTQLRERVYTLLRRVDLDDSLAGRLPHELSGGQRQRVGIARALALEPEFLICDEPVTALDVSIQSAILNLLADLQAERNRTYLIIAHDLAVIEYVSDRVAVMHAGRIVETGTTSTIMGNPSHPYTIALIKAASNHAPSGGNSHRSVPPQTAPPTGCRYHQRCPFATDLCRNKIPTMTPAPDANTDHHIACHHPQ